VSDEPRLGFRSCGLGFRPSGLDLGFRDGDLEDFQQVTPDHRES